MSAPSVPQPQEVLPARPSLTAVTAEGAVWTVLNMVMTRVLSIITQLVITRLLMPDELGVVGLAQFVMSVAGFIGQLSLMQFLINRQQRVRLYVNSAFWLSIALSSVSGLMIAASAPVAARLYHDDRLFGLLMFCAAVFPILGSSVVPMSLAQIRLQFKLVAVTAVASVVAQTVASIGAAWLGAGPYSIFIGALAAAVVRSLIICQRMNLRFHWRPRFRFRAERVMLACTSGWIVGVGLLNSILMQGDYATMGFYFDKEQIGYYFFGYNLAQQAVVVFSSSLLAVLFPAIATLTDRARQRAALMRAVRLLLLLVVPGGLGITFVIPPIVHVFGPKYLPAVLITQVMTVGAVGLLVNAPAIALMTAQERYRMLFFSTLLQTGVFLVLVFLGCQTRALLGVAIAVAVYSWIGGPFSLILALDGWRFRAETVWLVVKRVGAPALASAPAFFVALWVYLAIGSDGSMKADSIRAIGALAVFAVAAVPIVIVSMPDACLELSAVAGTVLAKMPGLRRFVRAV